MTRTGYFRSGSIKLSKSSASSAFLIVRCYAHHVFGVSSADILILVDQRLPHSAGVFLINAKDDRFLKPVVGFLQELRYFARHKLGSLVDYQITFEVLSVIDSILNLFAIAVQRAGLGTVALHIPVDMNFDDLVWREKAIRDSLADAINQTGGPK